MASRRSTTRQPKPRLPNLVQVLTLLARHGRLTVFDVGTGTAMAVESVCENGGIQINLAAEPEVVAQMTKPAPSHVRHRKGE